MRIEHCDLDDVGGVSGTVVVIDVLRAFTTAAVALAGGPASYTLVADLDEAFARRTDDPSVLLVGEVDGRRPPGFDLSNSPVEMEGAPVSGRAIVHRSSAGTQGAVRAVAASAVYVASLAVASATARAVAHLQTDVVTFCVTGRSFGRDGEEDRACADLIAALIRAPGAVGPMAAEEARARVRASDAGRMFCDPAVDWLPEADLDFACVVDRYDFAMPVSRDTAGLTLRRT